MSAAVLEAGLEERSPAATATACAHCGLPSAGRRFCCAGCQAAFDTVQALGFGRYYRERLLDPEQRPPRPDHAEPRDLTRYVSTDDCGVSEINLAVDGLQCGACVWLIESVLAREPAVIAGRINMTTRRLRLAARGGLAELERLVARVESLGYRLVPFDAALLAAARDRTGRALLRALAVAGFAAGNVMLISIGVWAGLAEGMGAATRDLMHWVSALIAMPAVAYAGMPFFRSAYRALRAGRTNMDVPISVGVVLVTALSLVETMQGARHAYFDSAVTLLFFLLIGRVLDHRARGQARATAEQVLTLRATDVAVMQPGGTLARIAQERVRPNDRVLVGMGERIGVDGVIERGSTTLDQSLVTGEALPVAAAPGARVFAGTVNLGEPLMVRATASGGGTLLAECARLIEAAEAARGRFVTFADRVARRYAPTVHIAAAGTFLLWWLVLRAPLETSLLNAVAVLIITCPCALALAVPAVQVIATSRLFRAGILLKSPTALERLAEIDTVVFDKTGTLTEPTLMLAGAAEPEALRVAASLGEASRHPLVRALAAAAGPVAPAEDVIEAPGQGLRCATPEGEIRLGSRAFCGLASHSNASLPAVTRQSPEPCGTEMPGSAPGHDATGWAERFPSARAHAGDSPAETPELWLARPGHDPVAFRFDERLRSDAAETVARLRALGLGVLLASGDKSAPVRRVAAALGIAEFHAEQTPVDKVALLERLRDQGRRVLMVGDGLNDGPSLAAAHVSASPATAADVSQTVADVVFQGERLAPVLAIIATARRARAVMRENLAFAIGYNALALPLAMAGFVTPWLAAAAMSGSSLTVIANSFRVRRGGVA